MERAHVPLDWSSVVITPVTMWATIAILIAISATIAVRRGPVRHVVVPISIGVARAVAVTGAIAAIVGVIVVGSADQRADGSAKRHAAKHSASDRRAIVVAIIPRCSKRGCHRAGEQSCICGGRDGLAIVSRSSVGCGLRRAIFSTELIIQASWSLASITKAGMVACPSDRKASRLGDWRHAGSPA